LKTVAIYGITVGMGLVDRNLCTLVGAVQKVSIGVSQLITASADPASARRPAIRVSTVHHTAISVDYFINVIKRFPVMEIA
jgi:hypothetical protein